MVHPEFAAMVAEAVKAKHPGASDSLIAVAVRGVATSPEFAPLAGFMDRGLAAGVFAQAITAQAQSIADAASRVSAPTATAQPGTRPKNPTTWLGQHYQQQAGERPDIESAALAERAAAPGAKPHAVLAHHRATTAPPTKAERKAAETPKVRTDDLSAIVDPAKRLEAFRTRTRDAKGVERLKIERTTYAAKALDKNLDPQTRALANIELAKIEARLKELDAA